LIRYNLRSKARLVRSPAMVRKAVKGSDSRATLSLGCPARPSFTVRTAILAETNLASPPERAALHVLNELDVASSARPCLMSISNASALEDLRAKMVQRLAGTVTTINSKLAQQSAIHDENQPILVQLEKELEAARTHLEALASAPQVAMSDIAARGRVPLAESDPTTSSPSDFVILGRRSVAPVGRADGV
jgi:hypothetical protein